MLAAHARQRPPVEGDAVAAGQRAARRPRARLASNRMRSALPAIGERAPAHRRRPPTLTAFMHRAAAAAARSRRPARGVSAPCSWMMSGATARRPTSSSASSGSTSSATILARPRALSARLSRRLERRDCAGSRRRTRSRRSRRRRRAPHRAPPRLEPADFHFDGHCDKLCEFASVETRRASGAKRSPLPVLSISVRPRAAWAALRFARRAHASGGRPRHAIARRLCRARRALRRQRPWLSHTAVPPSTTPSSSVANR